VILLCPLYSPTCWLRVYPPCTGGLRSPSGRGRLRRSGPPRPGTDRPAGYGKADASLDKLITCSQSQIGRCCHLRGWRTAQLAAALWLSVVVRSGTVQDCCECHAVARPSKMTLGTRSHRWFHPDRRVRPSSVTTMLRATGSCRVAVVPDVCWTGETLADQADSQRFLPPSATEPGRYPGSDGG
jgi:hypothetical protein